MSYIEKPKTSEGQKLKAVVDSIEVFIKAIARQLRKAKRAGRTKIRLKHRRKR